MSALYHPRTKVLSPRRLGRLSRIDEPANPLLAFREAIANENCHRDYASGGSAIGVAIYDDRLEVTSSGTLHFGCTPPALFDRHESQPRPWNSLIASVYYRCCIIETWGQGPLSMAAWSEWAELPKPEIVEIRARSWCDQVFRTMAATATFITPLT